MTTTHFEHAASKTLGTLRSSHTRAYQFDRSMIGHKLSTLYPVATGDADTSNSATLTAWTLFSAVMEFAGVAAHIVSIEGIPFNWPTAKSSALDLDSAFRFYLEDETGLFEEVKRLVTLMDNPNGTAAGPLEVLTEEQKVDPLSQTLGTSSS